MNLSDKRVQQISSHLFSSSSLSSFSNSLKPNMSATNSSSSAYGPAIVPVCKVFGKVQNYEWGKIGTQSLVAQLASSCVPSFTSSASSPYAELWLGTHPSGPSELLTSSSTISLRSAIGSDLPYLFKILSVAKALSIQAHPDKSLAAQLFSNDPKNYKDSNHKPEMTYSLGNFQAMSQFRPISQIQYFLETIQEFSSFFQNSTKNNFLKYNENEKQKQKEIFKQLFTELMETKEEKCKEQGTKLFDYLSKKTEAEIDNLMPTFLKDQNEEKKSSSGNENSLIHLNPFSLFLRLWKSYPNDIGTFCVFLLNSFILPFGCSMFLGPNEPHAYLYGDCVECMAGSDNVVRAGLTPKFRDVKTLCNMLTYNTGLPQINSGSSIDSFLKIHSPPKDFPEFRLSILNLNTMEKSYELKGEKSYAIGLVNQGKAEIHVTDERNQTSNTIKVEKGNAVLLPPQVNAIITNTGTTPFTLFRCSTNE